MNNLEKLNSKEMIEINGGDCTPLAYDVAQAVGFMWDYSGNNMDGCVSRVLKWLSQNDDC